MPAWTATVLTATAVALLAPFVVWGALTPPDRPFSWGMYSASSKAYLWHGDGRAGGTVLSTRQLGLSPEGHFLTLRDLRPLFADGESRTPLWGYVIGSDGGWQVRYTPADRRLYLARLPAGRELDVLAHALRESG
ncbi:hypothetical protein [Streptomyces sp. NPDC007369]|uniref:hypothetical protein n=1 Tax=Streptomyces sp. NPDC007369 TaxID=3154589 RepID=UPI0033CFA4C0